jgi:hypothetical protein
MKGKLSSKKLKMLGFTRHLKKDVFSNIKMRYWAKDAILLFYNESQSEYSWLIGYGYSTFGGNYHAATFRWIDQEQDLRDIYKAILNKEL